MLQCFKVGLIKEDLEDEVCIKNCRRKETREEKIAESRGEDGGKVWKKGKWIQRVPLVTQATFNVFCLFGLGPETVFEFFFHCFFFPKRSNLVQVFSSGVGARP